MADNNLAVSVYRAYLWTSGKSATDPKALRGKKDLESIVKDAIDRYPELAAAVLDKILHGKIVRSDDLRSIIKGIVSGHAELTGTKIDDIGQGKIVKLDEIESAIREIGDKNPDLKLDKAVIDGIVKGKKIKSEKLITMIRQLNKEVSGYMSELRKFQKKMPDYVKGQKYDKIKSGAKKIQEDGKRKPYLICDNLQDVQNCNVADDPDTIKENINRNMNEALFRNSKLGDHAGTVVTNIDTPNWGSLTEGSVKHVIQGVVAQKPYLAQAALDRIQTGLALSGERSVDLNADLNPYSLTRAAKYTIWKELTKTDIYDEVGYKLDSPNFIDNTVAKWPRFGEPFKNVSFNSNLNVECIPGGSIAGNHGWTGHLLKPERISSIKLNDFGAAARIYGDIYVSVSGDWENSGYSRLDNLSTKDSNGKDININEREPQDLGSDSKIDVKGEMVFLNPLTYLLFGDRNRYMSLKYTQFFNENARGEAVTPFAPGKKESGYRGDAFFSLTNGAGGAVGIGFDYYSFWGNEQNLPGDSGWFAYKRYGVGYNILYSGKVGAIDLGIKVNGDIGNGTYSTVGGFMNWKGKNPGLPAIPDLGSGEGNMNQGEGDWNRYIEQNRGGELTIGLNTLVVKALNAYPVIGFKVATSSVKDREHSDIYSARVNLGGFEVSGSRAVNLIPRENSGLPNLYSYLWNVKVPLDAAYWISRNNGEPDPRVSAGVVLNIGGYDQAAPCAGIPSNSGVYFNVALKFGPGSATNKVKEDLKITQTPLSQQINDVDPNISELKVKHDTEKDSNQLRKRDRQEPSWTNRGLRINITKEESPKVEEKLSSGSSGSDEKNKIDLTEINKQPDKKPNPSVVPAVKKETPFTGTTEEIKKVLTPATTGEIKMGELPGATTGHEQVTVNKKAEAPVKKGKNK